MRYTEVTFTLDPIDPYKDLIVYALGDEGPYESFADCDGGVKAYIASEMFDTALIDNAIAENCAGCKVSYSYEVMPDKDWNEEWEKQHKAVIVDNICYVRAPFHPSLAEIGEAIAHEIIIEPKMSFGTAHHATTYLMIEALGTIALEGLDVLDMGCGTAVLAILAKKCGAAAVDAIDIDEWAYRNAMENAERNNSEIHCMIGDASLLDGRQLYDVVIANINRNILLHDMEAYARVLKDGGRLLLSGFYEKDADILLAKGKDYGLALERKESREGWQMLQLKKDRD